MFPSFPVKNNVNLSSCWHVFIVRPTINLIRRASVVLYLIYGILACGILACGILACGILACGILACGILACGILACGILACGILACGILACGILACGILACGILACGILACGILACGILACGILACGTRILCLSAKGVLHMAAVFSAWAWLFDVWLLYSLVSDRAAGKLLAASQDLHDGKHRSRGSTGTVRVRQATPSDPGPTHPRPVA